MTEQNEFQTEYELSPAAKHALQSGQNIDELIANKAELYAEFCERCAESNVQPCSSVMFTKWIKGTAKRTLAGLPIDEICQRHIDYWQGKK